MLNAAFIRAVAAVIATSLRLVSFNRDYDKIRLGRGNGLRFVKLLLTILKVDCERRNVECDLRVRSESNLLGSGLCLSFGNCVNDLF